MFTKNIDPTLNQLYKEKQGLEKQIDWYISEGLGKSTKVELFKFRVAWLDLKIAILEALKDV